jgi:hypothetical protein
MRPLEIEKRSFENDIKRRYTEIAHKEDKWVQIAASIIQWRAYV